MEEIVNRVSNSQLVSLDLEQLLPDYEIEEIDLAPILHQGLVLKESDLRLFAKQHPWPNYQDKIVAVFSSVDAIIPTWAYMLIASNLAPFTRHVHFGAPLEVLERVYLEFLRQADWSPYSNAKVVVKGCAKRFVPTSCFLFVAVALTSVASSLMFGEPCSTVPIYKKKVSTKTVEYQVVFLDSSNFLNFFSIQSLVRTGKYLPLHSQFGWRQRNGGIGESLRGFFSTRGIQ
ncbi:MAG: DUF2480 family protein [Cytophagales bacterium]|nr:DUF2480 family protein [Cytophagales bacterium]